MFVLVAVSWSSAPERIPVHWDLSGQPDRYGGKFEGLLLLPPTALGLYLLLLLLPRIDPRRANYARFRGAYFVLRVAILMFLVLIYGFVLLWTRRIRLDVLVIRILVGRLLVVMGVVMGRVQPNWFVGIRTPWTLSSDLSWRETHRLGGWPFACSACVWAALVAPLTSGLLHRSPGVLLWRMFRFLSLHPDAIRRARFFSGEITHRTSEKNPDAVGFTPHARPVS